MKKLHNEQDRTEGFLSSGSAYRLTSSSIPVSAGAKNEALGSEWARATYYLFLLSRRLKRTSCWKKCPWLQQLKALPPALLPLQISLLQIWIWQLIWIQEQKLLMLLFLSESGSSADASVHPQQWKGLLYLPDQLDKLYAKLRVSRASSFSLNYNRRNLRPCLLFFPFEKVSIRVPG